MHIYSRYENIYLVATLSPHFNMEIHASIQKQLPCSNVFTAAQSALIGERKQL